mmetsp:Transcript_52303/g.156060  ORF Transcript_52303/g.156060 Transcript_52303/m.156060 type:complete len:337 (-) Transcript_52303:42-1052(-)
MAVPGAPTPPATHAETYALQAPAAWNIIVVRTLPPLEEAPLLVHQLRNGLPAHGEEGALDAVRQDPRAEAAAKEPGVALLLDDLLRGLQVADGLERGLPGGLQHAQGVGARVRDRGRREANGRVADILPKPELEGGQDLAQLVVGVEPRVVANPRGGHGADGALPESSGVLLRLLDEALEAVLALHLLGGLPRVNRHQEDAEPSGAGRRGHRLNCGGEGCVLQCGQRSVVGRRVAEAGDGGLDEARRQAAVEARDAALRVELLGHLDQAAAVPVLVVHDRAHPHEGQHVDGLRGHARKAAAQGLLRRLRHDLRHAGRGLVRHLCGSGQVRGTWQPG